MVMTLREALIKKMNENKTKLVEQLKAIDRYVKKLEMRGVKKLRFEVVSVSEDLGVLTHGFLEFEDGDEIDIKEFQDICDISVWEPCYIAFVENVEEIIKKFDEILRFNFYGYDLDDDVKYERISELVDRYVGTFDFYVDQKGKIIFDVEVPAGDYGRVGEIVVLVPVMLEESMLRRRGKGNWV
jgi:hypothetical protein